MIGTSASLFLDVVKDRIMTTLCSSPPNFLRKLFLEFDALYVLSYTLS